MSEIEGIIEPSGPIECKPIRAQLIGGPRDGEAFIISPDNSMSPPEQFCFNGGSLPNVKWPVWMVYEFEVGFVRPWHMLGDDRVLNYNFIGFRNMIEGGWIETPK